MSQNSWLNCKSSCSYSYVKMIEMAKLKKLLWSDGKTDIKYVVYDGSVYCAKLWKSSRKREKI